MSLNAIRRHTFATSRKHEPKGQRLLVLAAALVLVSFCFKAVIQGDGIGYYSYLPSVVADRSIDLAPTFDEFLAAGVPAQSSNLQMRLPNGLTADYKQVGSALMALPFYLATEALLDLTPAREDPALDPAYQFAYTAAGLAYVLLALVLLYRFARRLWSRWSSALAIAAAVFGTPLLAYLFFEPSYSHVFSVAAITIFALALYLTGPDRRWWQWLVLGLVGGIMTITHVQEILFMALVPAEMLWTIVTKKWSTRYLPGYALLALGFAIGVAPQVILDQVLFNRWLPPPAPNIGFDFLHPHLADMLFSTHHGWLSWTPLVAIAFLGFPLLVRRLGWFAVALIAIGAGELWLNASLTDWWGGLGFGSRRLTDQTLLLVLGYAALFDWLRRRAPQLVIGLVGAGVAWTLVLLAQYYYIIRADIGPSWHDFLAGQFRALPYVPRLFIQGTIIRDVAQGDFVAGLLTALLLAMLLWVVLMLGRRIPIRKVPEPALIKAR